MKRTARFAKSLSIVLLLALLPPTNAVAQDERIQRIEPNAVAQDAKIQQIDRRVPSIPPPPPTEAISGWWDEPIDVSPRDFPGKVIASLAVPEGSYVIFAKMEVSTKTDTNALVGCRLIAGADTDLAHESWGQADQRAPLVVFSPQTIALNVVHTYTSSGSALLQCWGRSARLSDGAVFSVGVENIKITAIRVAKLTNNRLKSLTGQEAWSPLP